MNNGGKCIESRYNTKTPQGDKNAPLIVAGALNIELNPPFDLIYLWCACPDPSAQVHFEYQSAPFPKQLVVPDTNGKIQVEEKEIVILPIQPNVRDKDRRFNLTSISPPSIQTRDINDSIANVTTNVIAQIPQVNEENLVLEKTLAIVIVVVIAVTAVLLTFILAKCFMKQSSIGQMQDDKGCKHSVKAWLDKNLWVFCRLRGRGREEHSQNDMAQEEEGNDIQQVEHVDIHIDEEDATRPQSNQEKSVVQLAAVPSIIKKNEMPDKKIVIVEHQNPRGGDIPQRSRKRNSLQDNLYLNGPAF